MNVYYIQTILYVNEFNLRKTLVLQRINQYGTPNQRKRRADKTAHH